MAPVSGPRYRDRDELTRGGIVNIISYWPASQRTHWYNARICLGETQTDTLNCFDLCYSFQDAVPGGIWGNLSAPFHREELHVQLYLVRQTTSELADTL